MRLLLAGAGGLVLLGSGLASAQQMQSGQAVLGLSVVETVERLKPGEFLWAPQIAPSGPVVLIVSVATQRDSLSEWRVDRCHDGLDRQVRP